MLFGIETLEKVELKALCFGLPQIWDNQGSFFPFLLRK